MARHIDPSYYELIERWARNQLLENQFLKPELAIPEGDFLQREAVAKALYGSWASWSLPNSLDNGLKAVEGCCLGAGIRGCYLVWDNIIQKRGDRVFVNLAFSRNSPWVEVISYQPYEGRLDVLVDDAPKLKIRIPTWVSETDIRVTVKERPFNVTFSPEHYVELNGLKKGERVKIEYPLRKEEITELVNKQEYNVRWRGDTVVNIEPKGEKYLLFERKWMEQQNAPLVLGQPYKKQKGGPFHW